MKVATRRTEDRKELTWTLIPDGFGRISEGEEWMTWTSVGGVWWFVVEEMGWEPIQVRWDKGWRWVGGVVCTPLCVLSVHFIQQGRGISSNRHGCAFDHGAGGRSWGHPCGFLSPLGLFLLQPLLGHLSPVHCWGVAAAAARPAGKRGGVLIHDKASAGLAPPSGTTLQQSNVFFGQKGDFSIQILFIYLPINQSYIFHIHIPTKQKHSPLLLWLWLRLLLLLRRASSGWRGGWRRSWRVTVMAAVRSVAVMWKVLVVCVRRLRGGAGVLWGAQGLLAGRGVGVAGGHHGCGYGLLRCSEHLQKTRKASIIVLVKWKNIFNALFSSSFFVFQSPKNFIAQT